MFSRLSREVRWTRRDMSDEALITHPSELVPCTPVHTCAVEFRCSNFARLIKDEDKNCDKTDGKFERDTQPSATLQLTDKTAHFTKNETHIGVKNWMRSIGSSSKRLCSTETNTKDFD